MRALDLQNMDDAERLLAPLLVQGRPDPPPYRFSHRIRIAAPRPWQAFDRGDHHIEHDVVEGFASRILLGDADQINLGIVGQLALLGYGNGYKNAPRKAHPPPLGHSP